MIELSYGEILDYARAAIAEKGDDYVYHASDGGSSCWYVHRLEGVDTPGCIVGNILHQAGVPLNELARREGGLIGLLSSLEQAEILKVDSDTEIFLSVAQAVQDRKGTWGSAFGGGETAALMHREISNRSE